jgi:uncharacterized membrane protein
MTKFKKTFFAVCLLLLIAVTCGLVTQSTALAAPTDTISLAPLPPEQNSEPEEKIKINSKYPVVSSYSAPVFEFDIELTYEGGEEPRYFEFVVDVPPDFIYAIQKGTGGTEIPGINLDPTKSYSPDKVKLTVGVVRRLLEPGEYPITFQAISEDLKGKIDLKAIVTEKDVLEITTETGQLDTKVTANKDNYFPIIINNTGTAELKKIQFESKIRGAPSGWSVTFDPEEIESLPVDSDKEVQINIKPPDKTIAGDYEITISVEPESKRTSDSVDIRVQVLTPTIWGWVGVGIVVLVVIGLAVMFLRLGRR